jgi:hypothetical protein
MQARQGFGLNFAHGDTGAAHAHQELPEAIVELLDVSEHAHAQMVRAVHRRRPCSAGKRSELCGRTCLLVGRPLFLTEVLRAALKVPRMIGAPRFAIFLQRQSTA